MQDFKLTPDMLTLGGVFYPRGYAFIMFLTAQNAELAGSEIASQPVRQTDEKKGGENDAASVMRLSPATVLRDIGKINGESDVALPSVGTEGATVRKYVDLARQGHHALMVRVSSDEEAERLMMVARREHFSYAQRYHLLAIEDLE